MIVPKIKAMIDKAIMVFNVLFLFLFQRRHKDRTGEVLLIFSGGFGDGIIDLQAIREIVADLNAKGKKVSILAVQPNCEIFSMFFPTQEAMLLPCSYLIGKNSTPQKRKEYREMVKNLRNIRWEQIIIRFNRADLKVLFIELALPALHKTAVLYCDKPSSTKKKVVYKLIKQSVDQIIDVSEEQTQMQMSRRFAESMGVKPYRIRLTHLPEQRAAQAMDTPYITVTVDSNIPQKRWPYENFISLIQRLLSEYPYDVVLTGVNVPAAEQEGYIHTFGLNNRVKNKIGRTALKEWIELIRGAQFHIGVDSSSIHVAAAVGTQAFCLAGVWDKNRFFPYQIEEQTAGTAEPICIYRKDVDISTLFCANCNRRGRMGHGNPECQAQCQKGKPCLCLENISVNDVWAALKKARCDGVIKG